MLEKRIALNCAVYHLLGKVHPNIQPFAKPFTMAWERGRQKSGYFSRRSKAQVRF